MDINKVFAESYIQSANPTIGQSCPIVIYAEGNQFMMKNQYVNGEIQDACFFQELLCSLLALKLNVPIPEFVIIEIDKDFLDNNPSLRFERKIKEGLYFATRIIDNVENNLLKNYTLALQQGQPRIRYSWNRFFKDIKNESAIPKIISFDTLISNFDRYGNEGNILVARNEHSERCIYAIDHGHSFYGPFYGKDIIKKRQTLNLNSNPNSFIPFYLDLLLKSGRTGLNLGPIFSGLEQNISFESNPFMDIIYDIENLNDFDIQEILDQIPNEWIVAGSNQKNDYFNYLIRQRRLVREIINQLALRSTFTNHTGGVLQWKNQEESSGTV